MVFVIGCDYPLQIVNFVNNFSSDLAAFVIKNHAILLIDLRQIHY